MRFILCLDNNFGEKKKKKRKGKGGKGKEGKRNGRKVTLFVKEGREKEGDGSFPFKSFQY